MGSRAAYLWCARGVPKSPLWAALFVFVAGVNDVPALATGDCAIEVPRDSRTFKLKAGETYTFTVASNRFRHSRKASRRFTLPGGKKG